MFFLFFVLTAFCSSDCSRDHFDDRGVCVLFVTGYIILFLPSKLTKIDD